MPFFLLLHGIEIYDKFVHYGGFTLIVIATFLETGVLIGMVLPGGETLLFTAGLLCGLHTLKVPITIMIPTLMAASIAGDFTDYRIGQRLGESIYSRKDSFFFRKKYLLRAQSFFKKHGHRAFILGRCIPIVRTFNPFIAGASKIPLKKFLPLAAIGSVILVGVLVTGGYLIAREFPGVRHYVKYIIPCVILAAVVPLIVSVVRDKRKR